RRIKSAKATDFASLIFSQPAKGWMADSRMRKKGAGTASSPLKMKPDLKPLGTGYPFLNQHSQGLPQFLEELRARQAPGKGHWCFAQLGMAIAKISGEI